MNQLRVYGSDYLADQHGSFCGVSYRLFDQENDEVFS